MKDTAQIEEAVDRLVGGAVERRVDEGPSAEGGPAGGGVRR
ncbi:hypothetical protein ABZS71_07600 [Streptomyces sp. NPDC005393]